MYSVLRPPWLQGAVRRLRSTRNLRAVEVGPLGIMLDMAIQYCSEVLAAPVTRRSYRRSHLHPRLLLRLRLRLQLRMLGRQLDGCHEDPLHPNRPHRRAR